MTRISIEELLAADRPSSSVPEMVLEDSERELLEGCRRGDREAFRELFESYKDKVYSVALRYSGDPVAAMDIAQDTFLKLYSTIGRFRGDSSFETWVYRMVVNSCLDQKRRAWRVMPLADAVTSKLRAAGDCLTDLLRLERAGRVRSAIERLTPDLRITVVLRYTEGLSYAEIAEVLGLSLGTVASRLNRAHKNLEKRLGPLVGKEEDDRV